MAKIKFGMMMTDARGKLGGQVFSKNRSGAYVRTKVTPVNPRTIFQQANRSMLGSVSSGWSGLTEAQRNAWNGAVEQWQKTNVFGDLVKPSGKNLYTSLNKVLLQHYPGEVKMDVPPAKVEFQPFVLSAVSTAAGALNVIFAPEYPVGQSFRIRATPPISVGTTFVQNLLRTIGETFDVTETGIVNILAPYTSRFGGPVSGLKIAVEVTPIAENGQLGVPAIVEGILL